MFKMSFKKLTSNRHHPRDLKPCTEENLLLYLLYFDFSGYSFSKTLNELLFKSRAMRTAEIRIFKLFYLLDFLTGLTD